MLPLWRAARRYPRGEGGARRLSPLSQGHALALAAKHPEGSVVTFEEHRNSPVRKTGKSISVESRRALEREKRELEEKAKALKDDFYHRTAKHWGIKP